MQRKGLLKKSSIRNAEYYDMIGVQDRLYSESAKGRVFTDLIGIICSDANIKMAYRNLKGNDGSNTPGVDGMTFENLRDISEMELITKVRLMDRKRRKNRIFQREKERKKVCSIREGQPSLSKNKL